MDDGVAKGAGHVLIHLRDDGLGAFCSGEGDVGGDTEGAVAFFIGLAHIEERYIYGY